MRTAAFALVLALCCAGFAGTAQAERATIGPHLGFNLDLDDPFLGIESRIDLTNISSNVILQLNPSFSYYFTDNIDLFNFALNLPFEFLIDDSVLRPFAAPGLALVHVSAGGGSDTDAQLVLLAGLLFRLGVVDPYFQIRVLIGDGSSAELMGGVLFAL